MRSICKECNAIARHTHESIWIRKRAPNTTNRDEGAHYLSNMYDPILAGRRRAVDYQFWWSSLLECTKLSTVSQFTVQWINPYKYIFLQICGLFNDSFSILLYYRPVLYYRLVPNKIKKKFEKWSFWTYVFSLLMYSLSKNVTEPNQVFFYERHDKLSYCFISR